MHDLNQAVSETFGEFLRVNGFELEASFEEASSHHLIFRNDSMKIRFSYGRGDRLDEVTVTLGHLDAPNTCEMWYPLFYQHSPEDRWLHVGDFDRQMTDEEYDAWVLKQFRLNGPARIEPPSLRGDLRRYRDKIAENIERINHRFDVQLEI